MKKTILLGMLGCLCFAVSVRAQLQKGTKYVGGTVSFSGYNNRPNKEVDQPTNFNQISFNPSLQVGSFVKDKVMVGVGAGAALYFGWTKSKFSGALPDFKENRQTYSLSPFIRHYKSLSPKWAIFLNSSAEFLFLRSRMNVVPFDIIENGFAAGIQIIPGISYWISPRFALESDINLLSLSTGYRNFQDTKSLYFTSAATSNLNSYFSIRASWYLQKP